MTTLEPSQVKKIAILTGLGLTNNPRVRKEATALASAGFDVTVLGGWLLNPSTEQDLALAERGGFGFVPVARLDQADSRGHWLRFYYRGRAKLARFVHQSFKIESKHQLGYLVTELQNAAHKLNADFYIVHMEQAMWVGSQLLRAGRSVGFDIEDWHSEDLLPEARHARPLNLLRTLEKSLLHAATYCTCPSLAMAQALALEFNCQPPKVIYNAFEWREREALDRQIKDRKNTRIPSIHWYSQTIGPGRGLDDLLAALPHLNYEVELHLRGNLAQGFRDWLTARIPEKYRQKVYLHEVVSNDELLSRIAEHDIGFAGEMKFCRNRDLTITNKILHYLLGGLAVVASDTAGQREVAAQAEGAVRLYPSENAEALAAQLNLLLSSPASLAVAKKAALQAAEQKFCWERNAPQLIDLAQSAIGRSGLRSLTPSLKSANPPVESAAI